MTNEKIGDAEWVLVPREPTDEMIEAGFEALRDGAEWGRMKVPSDIYQAMLASAPPSPPAGGFVEGIEAAVANAIAALRACLANPQLSDGQRGAVESALSEIFAVKPEWTTPAPIAARESTATSWIEEAQQHVAHILAFATSSGSDNWRDCTTYIERQARLLKSLFDAAPQAPATEWMRPRAAGNCPFCGGAPGNQHNEMCGLKDVPWEGPQAPATEWMLNAAKEILDLWRKSPTLIAPGQDIAAIIAKHAPQSPPVHEVGGQGVGPKNHNNSRGGS